MSAEFSASLAMAGLKMAEESAKKTEQEHDLAIWWEAYLTAFSLWTKKIEPWEATVHANCSATYALEHYKAKAAELRGK